MSIATSLLLANDEENLMTKFSAKKQNLILKACLYLVMLPWQWHIHHLNYQNTDVCAVNLHIASFGDQRIKGV